MRAVARQFKASLAAVQFWVRRAEGRRLNRVDWSDRASGCRVAPNRTPAKIEDMVLRLRKQLKEKSDLGEFGAEAIYREFIRLGFDEVPSVRTIGRILERRGALDGRKRIRRSPPPRGWYIPDVARHKVELDCFDIVEGMHLKGKTSVEVFNGISLFGGLVVSWPLTAITAKTAANCLIEHWREVGLPAYAQFDNDTCFQGPHHHRDVIGRVMRTCLALGVVPVFTPPRETGFQATIENYNGQWQTRVWARFHHRSLPELQKRSDRYVTASRRRAVSRIETAPDRRPFPEGWQLDLQRRPRGRIVYLRRTSDRGAVSLLGRTFEVDPLWPHRLVRCEVDLVAQGIRFFALRRRDPTWQPQLREVPYTLPRRRFIE